MLRKDKLNNIEVIISKGLETHILIMIIVNNVLIEYNEIKEEIKNPENSVEYIIQKQ